jgi:hypothetical protein
VQELAGYNTFYRWRCGREREEIPCQLRILQNPPNEIEIELHGAVVHRQAVPVLRDALPALVVGEVAGFALDGKEAF